MERVFPYLNPSSKSEVKEEFEKFYGICTLAWNLSLTGETYEDSIEELKSLALDEEYLAARMGMKYMLIQALRMLFLLPLDDESVCNAIIDIFTPEELEYYTQNLI